MIADRTLKRYFGTFIPLGARKGLSNCRYILIIHWSSIVVGTTASVTQHMIADNFDNSIAYG
jgi:hypothetical protein